MSTLNFKSTKLQAAMKYGGITGGAAVLSTIMFYLRGNLMESNFSSVNGMILIVGITIFTRRYRDKFLGGTINFGKAFNFGFLITLFHSGLIGLLYYTLYNSDASLIQTITIQAEENFANWNFSDQELDMMLEIIPKVYTPFVLSFSQFIGNVIFGSIIALITAAFSKRNGNPFEDTMKEIKD